MVAGPVQVACALFLAKLTGFALEMGDPASAGDDPGILPTIAVLLIITGFLLWKYVPGDGRIHPWRMRR